MLGAVIAMTCLMKLFCATELEEGEGACVRGGLPCCCCGVVSFWIHGGCGMGQCQEVINEFFCGGLVLPCL